MNTTILPDSDLKAKLSPEQYRVTQKKGTERPHTGKYNKHTETGSYNCVCCSQQLFLSEHKYDSKTGWPSFFQPASSQAVAEVEDNSLFMRRVEVVCKSCKAHLGHVFPDGPQPTGMRYCINSAALDFSQQR